MNELDFAKGEKVWVRPYRDNPFIEVVGYISKIGRGIICKISYVKIIGIKKNTDGDFLKVKLKLYYYDWDLINLFDDEKNRKNNEINYSEDKK